MTDTDTVKCSECGSLFVQEHGCAACFAARLAHVQAEAAKPGPVRIKVPPLNRTRAYYIIHAVNDQGGMEEPLPPFKTLTLARDAALDIEEDYPGGVSITCVRTYSELVWTNKP